MRVWWVNVAPLSMPQPSQRGRTQLQSPLGLTAHLATQGINVLHSRGRAGEGQGAWQCMLDEVWRSEQAYIEILLNVAFCRLTQARAASVGLGLPRVLHDI
eukprot:6180455-Pleurochrysis_carterae.AAC.1